MKKMIFALFAGMFAVILSGCSKSEELAGVLEVSVQTLTSKQPGLSGYYYEKHQFDAVCRVQTRCDG